MFPFALLVTIAFPFPRASPWFSFPFPIALTITLPVAIAIPLTFSVAIAIPLSFPLARWRSLEAPFLHFDSIFVDEFLLLAEQLLVADRTVVDVGQELLTAERVAHQLICSCFYASFEIRVDQHLSG